MPALQSSTGACAGLVTPSPFTLGDAALLPPLFLIIDERPTGKTSGQVHGSVKERWLAGDPAVRCEGAPRQRGSPVHPPDACCFKSRRAHPKLEKGALGSCRASGFDTAQEGNPVPRCLQGLNAG